MTILYALLVFLVKMLVTTITTLYDSQSCKQRDKHRCYDISQISWIFTRSMANTNTKMTRNERFGLPDIIVEVLRKQNLDTSLHLSYKVFGTEQYTELKLTWSPIKDREVKYKDCQENNTLSL